jgi:hypothetical protein
MMSRVTNRTNAHIGAPGWAIPYIAAGRLPLRRGGRSTKRGAELVTQCYNFASCGVSLIRETFGAFTPACRLAPLGRRPRSNKGVEMFRRHANDALVLCAQVTPAETI